MVLRKKLTSLNGWQRLWVVISSAFFLAYVYVMLVAPLALGKTYENVLSNYVYGFKFLEFPVYGNLDRVSPQLGFFSTTISPVTLELEDEQSKWVKENYPKFGGIGFKERGDKWCSDVYPFYPAHSLTYGYVNGKLAMAAYAYVGKSGSMYWENVAWSEYPPAKNPDEGCYLSVGIKENLKVDASHTPSYTFYSPINKVDSPEVMAIVEHFLSGISSFLWKARIAWIFKTMAVCLGFSLALYFVGFTVKWVRRGFQ